MIKSIINIGHIITIITLYILITFLYYLLVPFTIGVLFWDMDVYYSLATNEAYALCIGPLSLYAGALITDYLYTRGGVKG